MSKKDKIIHAKLIANPNAGKQPEQASKNLELATRYLQQNGIEVDVALAKPKAEAIPIAKRAVKDGYKLIIAMGGDGTIEAVVRGMVNSKVRLGILPTGTQNNMARSLGIPEKLEDACSLIASKNTRKLDLGQVKLKNGQKTYFFELAAFGLVSALYRDVNKIQNGNWSGIKDAALTLIHHETQPIVYLTLDDESKIKVETMLVVVSNTPIFGKNFLVAPKASLQDGLLDISVYPNFTKPELLAYYAKVMDEGYSSNAKIQRYRARKLTVKADPKLDVLADGVLIGKGSAKIKILPKAIWIITPEGTDAPATLDGGKSADAELPPPVYPVEETVSPPKS